MFKAIKGLFNAHRGKLWSHAILFKYSPAIYQPCDLEQLFNICAAQFPHLKGGRG